MKHIIMLVALLCCVMAMGATTISNSSNQASLQGYVTDAQGGDTLIGVTVALPELNIATTTDAKGHYSFKGLPQLYKCRKASKGALQLCSGICDFRQP